MPPLLRHAVYFLVGGIAVVTLMAQDHIQPASTPAKPAEILAGVSESSTDLEKGRRLFETHCAICHGPRGEGGKGPTLAQPTLPRASDEDSLIRIIWQGIPNTEMPQARLEPPDILLVAKFVKSLGSQSRALACHVTIADIPPSESAAILESLNRVLKTHFNICHATIQFEHENCVVTDGCVVPIDQMSTGADPAPHGHVH